MTSNLDNKKNLEIIRHDCAHVLAEAVQSLYPDTLVSIGPTIENGFYYDFEREKPFTSEDLNHIEKKMFEIIARGDKFKKETWTRKEAIQYFSKKGEKYKVELINDISESEEITIYKQGAWLDLCRGPHGESTRDIGDGFKLTKVAGAYWRGDSSNKMLTRIYGTAWKNKKELKNYLIQLEEAEKRDHRKIGKEMNLFHFQEEAPGAVFWHPKGWYLFQSLINYMRKRQENADYVETNTPDLLDRSLWETSGHWEKFGENMFTTEAKEDRVFAIKPMNCPGAVEVYKQGLKSYRDLPLRMAEFGKVHRYEPSGALHGLMRVRAFTQDDAHIFCTEDQITSESKIVCDLILSIYKDFGFENVRIKYSDRPEKRVGTDEIWDKAEKALINAMESTNLDYTHNPGEGAFYGPKLEFVLRDAIGRDWQCGTLQVDLNLPGRLNANYVGEDGQKKIPVMLHRALFGSLERFAGILIEHYAGHLPFWLSPLQIIIATITSDTNSYAENIYNKFREKGFRIEKDLRNEKIGYKIREHSTAKVPIIIVVGKKEAENQTLSLRKLGNNKTETFKIDDILEQLLKEKMSPIDIN
ncbi:MAG: Threonine--tRNA ligase [Alphaproteobacteria bacterium MarineAlpha5_Bin8]|nr:MAG: Threonine--tRNA ligase [Alphaproteobacteria bacterium MarineAlpha5_Bin7]PPR48182.1 MAG: Threonine--tRNA ligase [Alphaproteobacteria bacterium MarineAlpha5_Bin8]PPR54613.1 MAG: Threonine--tRNA ligase [Alphaproteobacteria bacterium MarineAlpha5_Bin6]|tara:strand:- start:7542 stop:9293 length:1752 start_codon:yes stop_codon:yes gene_type:complete